MVIPQIQFGFFLTFKQSVWPLSSTVWLFIKIVIWQPCLQGLVISVHMSFLQVNDIEYVTSQLL